MNSGEVTETEIILAIQEAWKEGSGDGSGFVSTSEIQTTTGISVRTIRKLLAQLIKEGKVEVGRKTTVNLAGNRVRIPAYKFLKEEG